MRATTIHAPGDIRFEEVPDPTIEEPTDAIVKVVAGCICGSDLWPYRGHNDIDAGSTRSATSASASSRRSARRSPTSRPATSSSCRSATATTPARTAGPACSRGATTSASPRAARREYSRVTQADGSLVKTDGLPDDSLIPSLLTLSDVMATGWHAAVSAGVRPGGTAVVVGDGAVGLCGVLAAAQMGAERVIAMSRHESRQEIARALRRHRHRRRARQGGRGADRRAHRRHRRGRRARVRRHRRVDEDGLRGGATRLDGGFVGRAARRRAAGAPDVPEEHRAGRRHGARAQVPPRPARARAVGLRSTPAWSST